MFAGPGCCCWCALEAAAADGRLLGSGGVLSVDGSAGGGLVPWAVIAGHSGSGQWDVLASASVVDTGDFDLRTGAVALGWNNRLELSFARLSLGLDALVRTGQFPDERLETDVIGAKLRLGGDLIYGRAPQLAVGVQWRRSRDGDLVRFASADDDQGFDVYLSASKLWIDGIAGRRTLASLTVRSTDANQLGLAGFSDQRSLTLESSLACSSTRTGCSAWSIAASRINWSSRARTPGRMCSWPGCRRATGIWRSATPISARSAASTASVATT